MKVSCLILSLLSIVFLYSCSGNEKTVYSKEQRKIISDFSKKLSESLNEFDPGFIKNAWSDPAFEKRISGLNKVQKSVLTYILEKEVNDMIKFGNIRLVNVIADRKGHAYRTKLQHFSNHSEVTIFIILNETFSIIKYRIELKNNKPFLNDYYDFKQGLWFSESIKNSINLNSKYNAFSEERRKANQAYSRYISSINSGDYELALEALNDIPETHWIGNGLSLRKLELAIHLGEMEFAKALVEEKFRNPSVYMNYLYNTALADSSSVEKIVNNLSKKTGGRAALDTLLLQGYFWE